MRGAATHRPCHRERIGTPVPEREPPKDRPGRPLPQPGEATAGRSVGSPRAPQGELPGRRASRRRWRLSWVAFLRRGHDRAPRGVKAASLGPGRAGCAAGGVVRDGRGLPCDAHARGGRSRARRAGVCKLHREDDKPRTEVNASVIRAGHGATSIRFGSIRFAGGFQSRQLGDQRRGLWAIGHRFPFPVARTLDTAVFESGRSGGPIPAS